MFSELTPERPGFLPDHAVKVAIDPNVWHRVYGSELKCSESFIICVYRETCSKGSMPKTWVTDFALTPVIRHDTVVNFMAVIMT